MKAIRVLFVCVACGLSLELRAELFNGIMAVVQDAVVTRQEVDAFAAPTLESLSREFRGRQSEFQKKIEEERARSLEELIERQLVLFDFKSAGYNFPESIIDEEAENRMRSRFGNRSNAMKTLQGRGMTYEKYRQNLREQIIVEALVSKNVSSEIFISPHKVETYYLAHQDKYKLEDQAKLRIIVLPHSGENSARPLAEEVLRKIKEGAAFSEMASIYSQGSQRSQGGDWGWQEIRILRKELAEAVGKLKPGQVSDIIETPDQIYLMLVEDKRISHVRPLTEVQDDIERQLRGEEQKRLRNIYIDRLRKKTFVRYF